MRLSKNMMTVAPSPIPLVWDWAKEYDGKYGPNIDLCQGAPRDPPAKVLLDAIADASSDPTNSKYGPILGNQDLREALAKEMKVPYGDATDVTADDIAICSGANLAFYAVMMAVVDQGEEVILPIPWYFSHQMSLKMQGIKVVELPLDQENAFLPSVDLCESLITARTKAIALVTPNNPTGSVYSSELIRAFARLAQRHSVALIIDETYRDFILDGRPPHDLFNNPSSSDESDDWKWRDNFTHIFSFSKSYAVPGYRLGAIVAGPDAIEQINTVLDCIQICPSGAIQSALSPLLPTLRPLITSTAQQLDERHKLFRSIMPSNWIIGSSGGYFAFVKHPFERKGSAEICQKLAAMVGVLLLPGTFASPGDDPNKHDPYGRWIRFAVGNVEEETLKLIGDRLRLFERIWTIQ
ncbi:hypothetical protein FRB93_000532 [Tulasnella sp. JGI-2019a]|nr:hypothetical protein FRB93_000532 [Tulasnella sp. JGI-2019a]